MSLVGIAMTVPTIMFLLIGGVASDRFERRWLLVGADLLRAVALALLAGLTRRPGRVVACRRPCGPVRDRAAFRARPSTRSSRDPRRRTADPGQRAGPARAPAGAAPRGPGAGRRAGRRRAPARRTCSTRDVPDAPLDVLLMRRARAPRAVAAGGSMFADLARAGASSAATRGCGRRSSAPRSPTCSSWAPSRCSLPLVVKRELAARRSTSASCSPPAGWPRSVRRRARRLRPAARG